LQSSKDLHDQQPEPLYKDKGNQELYDKIELSLESVPALSTGEEGFPELKALKTTTFGEKPKQPSRQQQPYVGGGQTEREERETGQLSVEFLVNQHLAYGDFSGAANPCLWRLFWCC